MNDDELRRIRSRNRGGQHGNTSAITSGRADAVALGDEVARLRAAITQALVQLDDEINKGLANKLATETLRAAIGIEEGP